MKLVIAYVRPESLASVKQALFSKQIYSMSVTNILGAGRQKGFTEMYRGVQIEVNLLKKVRIEMGLSDDKVDGAIEAIMSAARTGKEGDGVVFVQDLGRAIRVRTGEEGLS